MNTKIQQLKQQLYGGVAPAMATPLQADGYSVNTAVIPQLVDFLIERGAAALFVGGTTGEGILLSLPERMCLHETAVAAANGRVPVMVHAGTNRQEDTLTLARHAQDLDVAAIAAVTPFYYAMHDDAICTYYKTISEAVPDQLILLYDIPHLAVNGISPELLMKLGKEVLLAGIKTSRKDTQQVRQLIDAAPEGSVVLVGNESVALGSLALGADGLISGLSTAVPEPFVALTAAFCEGNMAKAQETQRLINRMLTVLPSGARIGAVKQILTERGIAMGTAVPPRPMPTQPIWPQLKALLDA